MDLGWGGTLELNSWIVTDETRYLPHLTSTQRQYSNMYFSDILQPTVNLYYSSRVCIVVMSLDPFILR